MATIEIENVGPVESLSIPLPEKGGVVVLRGGHGAGKSTSLRAVSKMVGGKHKDLLPSDEHEKGLVQYGTAKLTVKPGRLTTTAAARALEVESIESRFDISHLVDPGIDDPIRADVARLKALVKLSGCESNINDYNDILPENVVLELDADTDDPIVLQGRVKQALEELARREERKSERLAAELAVGGEDIKGIDFTQEHNETTLREEYDKAKTHKDVLTERRANCLEQFKRRQEARGRIDEIKASFAGVKSSGELVDDLQAADEGIDKSEALVAELETKLAVAKERQKSAVEHYNQVEKQLHAVREHESLLADLAKVVEGDADEAPSLDAIAEAEAATDLAMARVERGATIREAIAKKSALADKSKEYVDVTKKAENLRESAAKTEDVLSRLIEGKALFLRSGRLCANTERSEHELYSELSHGERYIMAINIAVHNLPENGMLTICQEAWDSLNLESRNSIREHAIERGVVILTAEASEGELRAEEVS